MTSTTTSNPPVEPLNQTSATKTRTMTANANQDQNSQTNQHQEALIRLLALHFNNQFHQLAGGNQPNGSASAPASANTYQPIDHFQVSLAHFQQQQHLQQMQMQVRQQHHHRTGHDAINFSLPGRSSAPSSCPAAAAINLDGPSSSPTSFQPAASPLVVRSQAPPLPPPPGFGLPACSSLPLANGTDLSLFGALNNCFGLSQDQFVASLQQQYLLRAAAAAAAAATTSNAAGHRQFDQLASHDNQQQQQQQIAGTLSLQTNATQSGRRNPSSKTREPIEHTHQPGQSSRDLLKFSINTILGHGSPLPPVNGLLSSSLDSNSYANSATTARHNCNEREPAAGEKLPEFAFKQRQRASESDSPECDPDTLTDVDSNPSSAPSPNSHSNSLPNASHLDSHSHQSASSSTTANQHQRLAPNLGAASNPDAHLQHQHQQQSLSFLNSNAFPWTAASRGKPRRGMMRRAVFSDSQRVGLEKRFQLQKYISKPDRKKLAEKLGLRDSQVKIWFQNRRMKWRNSKERELLSAGGSREQTLPTRNNPNPDLSDVGETIKRLVGAGTANGINAV